MPAGAARIGAAVQNDLPPWDLANTVTGFCTLGAGVVTLILTRLVAPQPARWRFVYLCLVVTGLPTIGFHGFGGGLLRVSDTGTNLLLAWAMQPGGRTKAVTMSRVSCRVRRRAEDMRVTPWVPKVWSTHPRFVGMGGTIFFRRAEC